MSRRKIEVYTGLSKSDCYFVPVRADALRWHSQKPAGRSTLAERREAAAESVQLFQRLAATDSTFQPELAASLHAQATVNRRFWQKPRRQRST